MHLSLIQKQIWEKKAAGRTYNEILNNFPFVKHEFVAVMGEYLTFNRMFEFNGRNRSKS